MIPRHFSQSISGLEEAHPTGTLTVSPGGSFELKASPVRKRIGEADVRLLAYNGSVPGPTIRVQQGSEVVCRFVNELELDTTVHWHGLRHDYLYDGVPRGGLHGGMQDPVRPGQDFTYRLRFPDPGAYWYHPHMREDYAQEMGLYGNIIVEPQEPHYWPAAHRDLPLIVDDILLEDGAVAPFRMQGSSHTAMGRFGNVMLVNGETSPRFVARRGEVVRLYLTNAANTRVFRLHVPGALLKLVGSDLGRIEKERMVERLILAPSERWVVDTFFPDEGEYALEHVSEGKTYRLATFAVEAREAKPDLSGEFGRLRRNPEFAEERARWTEELEREPDRVLILQGDMVGTAMEHGGSAPTTRPLIEWEDDMPEHNAVSTPETMVWRIHDEGLGADNTAIHWVFEQGDRVKIRIINDPGSDHPMHHPVHFHGQRFYELRWDGGPAPGIMWKDTVLVPTGKTVDILLECSNPGSWVVHCHIAEHLEGGMMFTFEVHESMAAAG